MDHGWLKKTKKILALKQGCKADSFAYNKHVLEEEKMSTSYETLGPYYLYKC